MTEKSSTPTLVRNGVLGTCDRVRPSDELTLPYRLGKVCRQSESYPVPRLEFTRPE
jgi:hypothetical protein